MLEFEGCGAGDEGVRLYCRTVMTRFCLVWLCRCSEVLRAGVGLLGANVCFGVNVVYFFWGGGVMQVTVARI